MAYITPDLGLLFGYGPSSGPTPDAYDQQPTDPNDLLATLLAQHMTRGLDTNPQNIGGHQGQPMFNGPVGGYAGPLRQSDIPQSRIATTMKPEEASALDLARGTQFPGMGPGADLERIAAIMGSLKGLHEDAQNALLTKMGFGDIASSKLNQQKELAKYQHDLGAPDRAAVDADRKARILASINSLKERQLEFDMRNRTPLADAEKRLKEAWDAGERDPARLAAIAQGMGWYYQGGTSGKGLDMPSLGMAPSFNPRLGTSPVYSGAPQAAETPSAPAAPAQQGASVVVEKGGKRFKLPVGQLEEAQKQGYKLVR